MDELTPEEMGDMFVLFGRATEQQRYLLLSASEPPRSEPGADELREAVVAYFDGRRRRAPAAEMLRLITKMGDSLAATPAADSRGLDPMVTPVSQDVIRATQDAMQRLAEARSGPVFVPYEDATALAFAVVDAMRAEYAALTDPDPAP